MTIVTATTATTATTANAGAVPAIAPTAPAIATEVKNSFKLLSLTGASATKEAIAMFSKLPTQQQEDVVSFLLGDRATQVMGEKLDLYRVHESSLKVLDDNGKVAMLNAIYSIKGKGFDVTLKAR